MSAAMKKFLPLLGLQSRMREFLYILLAPLCSCSFVCLSFHPLFFRCFHPFPFFLPSFLLLLPPLLLFFASFLLFVLFFHSISSFVPTASDKGDILTFFTECCRCLNTVEHSEGSRFSERQRGKYKLHAQHIGSRVPDSYIQNSPIQTAVWSYRSIRTVRAGSSSFYVFRIWSWPFCKTAYATTTAKRKNVLRNHHG